MDRRTFLIGLGISSIVAAGAIGGIRLLSASKESLCDSLALLFDPSFEKVAAGKDANTFLSELRRKKVITENDVFDQPIIEKLAETDQMVSFEGYFYTQTELEVYGLAFLLQENCDLES
jgi:hypothetical protein